MKVTIPQSVKTIAKGVAKTSQEVGSATISYAKKLTTKADEFIKSNDNLKKITKEHVVGVGVLAVALSLSIGLIKGLKKDIDEEVKK